MWIPSTHRSTATINFVLYIAVSLIFILRKLRMEDGMWTPILAFIRVLLLLTTICPKLIQSTASCLELTDQRKCVLITTIII